jgi:hypothetical protein
MTVLLHDKQTQSSLTVKSVSITEVHVYLRHEYNEAGYVSVFHRMSHSHTLTKSDTDVNGMGVGAAGTRTGLGPRSVNQLFLGGKGHKHGIHCFFPGDLFT